MRQNLVNRVRALSLATLAMGTAACGGVDFERTALDTRYKPLPAKVKVQLAEEIAAVAQPAVVIGVLRLPASANSVSQVEAEKRFLAAAPRYGCDAVVGVDANARQVTKNVKKRVVAASGKVSVKTEKTQILQTQWTADCVRTAQAEARALAARQRRRAAGRTDVAAAGTTATTASPEPAPATPAT